MFRIHWHHPSSHIFHHHLNPSKHPDIRSKDRASLGSELPARPAEVGAAEAQPAAAPTGHRHHCGDDGGHASEQAPVDVSCGSSRFLSGRANFMY